MESKKTSRLDTFLWILSFALLGAGVYANGHFSEVAWTFRFVGWVFLFGVLIGLIALTASGKNLWVFAKHARVELRKVVWPTRDETMKITMVIAALVLAMSVILWGVDSVLLWGIGWITGQHG